VSHDDRRLATHDLCEKISPSILRQALDRGDSCRSRDPFGIRSFQSIASMVAASSGGIASAIESSLAISSGLSSPSCCTQNSLGVLIAGYAKASHEAHCTRRLIEASTRCEAGTISEDAPGSGLRRTRMYRQGLVGSEIHGTLMNERGKIVDTQTPRSLHMREPQTLAHAPTSRPWRGKPAGICLPVLRLA